MTTFRTTIRTGILVLLSTLATARAVRGGSLPADASSPTDTPRFVCGSPVEWADGSRGRVVDRPEWRTDAGIGQWYHRVRFGGPDSLLWLLPESGLAPLADEGEDAPGPRR